MSDSTTNRNRVLLKFTKPPDGLTRRVLFNERPSWAQLAAKIATLYGVPKGNVGVSYVDTDGDEVTLSSEEELQDFYRYSEGVNSEQADAENKAIRFAVRDITAPHDWESIHAPSSHTPPSSTRRNTFGAFPNMAYEMADDWQRVPSLGGGDFLMAVGRDQPESPHAFVEVLESDVSMSKDNDDDGSASTVTLDEEKGPKVDKGKGRARTADLESVLGGRDDASTVSMVDENAPRKPPVHVANATVPPRSSSTTVSVSRRSTPKPPPVDTTAAEDPPLPDLGADTPADPSLTTDVANLFNALSTVFATHPELSEGVRNIVRSATNGVYWSQHRRAVAQAAEEIRRSAYSSVDDVRKAAEEAHRQTEEAAGRRVAEAIGNVVRVISDTVQGPVPPPTVEPVTSTPVTARTNPPRPHSPSRRETWNGPFGPPRSHGPMWPGGRHGTFDERFYQEFGRQQRRPHRPPTPPSPPALPGHHHGPPPPPPPPPPFGPGRYGPALPMPPPSMFHPFNSYASYIPPPPPHFPPVPPRPPRRNDDLFDFTTGPSFGVPGAYGPWTTGPAPVGRNTLRRMDDAIPDPFAPAPMSRSVSQETRERLEAAKEAYKAEKERYRREKDGRRQGRERKVSEETRPVGQTTTQTTQATTTPVNKARDGGVSTSAAAGPSTSARSANAPDANGESVTIISNARGPYPQLEMVNVTPPRRHHTVTGASRSRARVPSGETTGPSRSFSTSQQHTATGGALRAGHAIKTKLADMGFTSEEYPDISKKVASRLSLAVSEDNNNNITQDVEDTIMSEVLDELLTANVDKELPPKPASTTTSVPGEWLN